MKCNTVFALAALLCGMIQAQAQSGLTGMEAITPEPANVQAATSHLIAVLGLDEKQAAIAGKLVEAAETDVAPMRAECKAIQKQVDAAYSPYYDQLEGSLNAEQREKYAQLRKNGGLTVGCGHMVVAGCDHEKGVGDAKAAGCCAGGKAKTSATGSSTFVPSKTAR